MSDLLPRLRLLLILLLVLPAPAAPGQIHSTASGGNWNDPATWQGGVVPGASDAVVLDGTVNLNVHAECGGLTVSAGGVLQTSVWHRTLFVHGDVVNHGAVRAGNGWELNLYVEGHLTSDGTWAPYRTYLDGAADQQVAFGAGTEWHGLVSDTQAGSRIVALTPLAFTAEVNVGGSTLVMGTHALTLRGDGHLHDGTVRLDGAFHSLDGAVLGYNTRYIGDIHLYETAQVASAGNVFEGSLTVEGTLQTASWHRTLVVEGDLVNLGTIRNNPDGWEFNLRITGDATNNGTWTPYRTHFDGEADQRLTLGAGRAWDSPITVSDTLGMLVAASPQTFAQEVYLGDGVLDMGTHTLTLKGDGHLHDGTVRLDGELHGLDGAVIGYNTRYVGDVSLHGTVQVAHNGNVFEGDVTVVDTLQTASWHRTLVVEGDLVNLGTIRNNPDGWEFNLHVTGDLIDRGVAWSNYCTYLAGVGRRTVYAPGLTGQLYLTGENVILVGENVLPWLTMGSGKGTVEAGGSLRLMRGMPPGDLVNRGEIVARRDVPGGSYDFYRARVGVVAGSGLDSLTIRHYGSQVPPTYANALRAWWRIEGTDASLDYLDLFYDDDQVGPNDEQTLAVYRSDDGGKTWRQVSTSQNLTRYPDQNFVRITGVPARGDYLLSSYPDPVSVRPSVVTSIIGRSQIRVGPPNLYVVHYANNSDVPTGDMAILIQAEGGVFIERIEPSAPPGASPQPLLPHDFALVPETQSALPPQSQAFLFVESMAPREERMFTVVLSAVPDVGKTLGPDGAEVLPVVAVYLGYAATGLAVSFVSDLVINGVEETFSSGESRSAGEIANATWQKTKKEWFGFEKPGKEILKDVAWHWGPGLALGPNVVFLKMAEFGVNTIFAMGQGANRYLNGDGSKAARSLQKVTSWDPNEKIGPAGVGEQGFMTSAGRLTYQILFENKKEATAPAWKITIDDTLAAAFDPSTIVFEGSSHPGWTFTVAGNVLRWEVEGIELPPNVNPPEGEGFVLFSVKARDDLASGTQFRNRATIVFDLNKPIMTNEVVNTLDFVAPVTVMEPLPAETASDSVVVRWRSDDGPEGSGVFSTTVYASVDGGAFEPVGTSNTGALAVAVAGGHAYAFYALSKDAVGNAEQVRPEPVGTYVAVGVEDDAGVPYAFALEPAYPNPFNPATTLRFSLAEPGEAVLEVYDATGRRVATLIDGPLARGWHQVRWDARHVASGVYFCRLRQRGQSQVRMLVLLK